MRLLSAVEVKATNAVAQMMQLGFTMLSFLHPSEYPPHAIVHDGQVFDFIILGGGTAGCVLASRLTETNYNVLLVEAGDDPPLLSDSPSAFLIADNEAIDWGYYSVNDGYSSQAHKTKNVRFVRGKMLSGSSGNNHLFYSRGNKADYDKWAVENKGWDWNALLPYFKKSESLRSRVVLNSETGLYHGTTGNIAVTRPNWEKRTKAYLEAFKENGRNVVLDNVGFQQIAYSSPMFTIHNGHRQSTGYKYLVPMANRRNLSVLKNTRVLKVLIQNRRAVGALLRLPNGSLIRVGAAKEVILSAGAINTPQLLMLSGIGPASHLKEKGIGVILDSPKVGKNLQDHAIVPIVLTGKKGISSVLHNFDALWNLKKMPLASIVGYAALNKGQSYPDYDATIFPTPAFSLIPNALCSYLFKLEENICTTLTNACRASENLFSILSLLHPESRGEVRLQSSNPLDIPLIHTGFYSNPKDLERNALYIEDYISVLNTTYFRQVKSKVVDMRLKQCTDFKFGSHDYWKCYALNVVMTQGHPVGTCTMGPQGVVDYKLRVNGIKGLRVVDASVMPEIISGGVNAAVIAIAEKAADMIKVDHKLVRGSARSAYVRH